MSPTAPSPPSPSLAPATANHPDVAGGRWASVRPGDQPGPWLVHTDRSRAVSSGRPPKLYRWTA